jgi:flagellar L-ring protein precursor FlgH
MLIALPVFLISTGITTSGLVCAGDYVIESLYSDKRAFDVGDVVTVLVVESSQASNEAMTETSKDASLSVSGGEGKGPLDFIPLFGLEASSKNDFEGAGKTTRSGTLTTKITAKVIRVLKNGNLLVEGTRVVEINQEKEILTLTGIARVRDISADNTIYSTSLADARISYQGKGAVRDGHRQGLISRFFNWIL